MRPNRDFPELRTTERAVCKLCGDEIITNNGGRHTGLAFVSFERLLDRHVEERHPNICLVPAISERRIAARTTARNLSALRPSQFSELSQFPISRASLTGRCNTI